jgi:hypothetical protein
MKNRNQNVRLGPSYEEPSDESCTQFDKRFIHVYIPTLVYKTSVKITLN